jgi:hypothetical protein
MCGYPPFRYTVVSPKQARRKGIKLVSGNTRRGLAEEFCNKQAFSVTSQFGSMLTFALRRSPRNLTGRVWHPVSGTAACVLLVPALLSLAVYEAQRSTGHKFVGMTALCLQTQPGAPDQLRTGHDCTARLSLATKRVVMGVNRHQPKRWASISESGVFNGW